jgi:hypothetical protein
MSIHYYKLTLTKSERDAIDWIGGRYAHGNDLRSILLGCETAMSNLMGSEWDEDIEIEFQIPEHRAWEIAEIIHVDSLACFSEKLVNKLETFKKEIV